MRKELEKIVLQSVIDEEVILGLAEELDQPGSEISKLVDVVLVNVILTALSREDRLTFYDLVEKTGASVTETELKIFIQQKIPNLEAKIVTKLRVILEETLLQQ